MNTSSVGGNTVAIRHWIFGWAMTFGASTIAATPSAPPALTRNVRRPVTALSASRRDELMVGALGDVIPRAHQRLELRERRVDLLRQRRLLRLFLDDFGAQLLEIAQHRRGEREDLDLRLELGLEVRERDGVLRVKVREAVDLDSCGSMVEGPPQIDR